MLSSKLTKALIYLQGSSQHKITSTAGEAGEASPADGLKSRQNILSINKHKSTRASLPERQASASTEPSLGLPWWNKHGDEEISWVLGVSLSSGNKLKDTKCKSR